MQFTTISALLAVLGLAAVAPAQTKISGTVQCGKPSEQHILEVGDQPHHSLMISKGKCTWTRPMEIVGTLTKEDVGTGFDESLATNPEAMATSSAPWPTGTRCTFVHRARQR